MLSKRFAQDKKQLFCHDLKPHDIIKVNKHILALDIPDERKISTLNQFLLNLISVQVVISKGVIKE